MFQISAYSFAKARSPLFNSSYELTNVNLLRLMDKHGMLERRFVPYNPSTEPVNPLSSRSQFQDSAIPSISISAKKTLMGLRSFSASLSSGYRMSLIAENVCIAARAPAVAAGFREDLARASRGNQR